MKIRAADKYFAYIAKAFPVMCASGAFSLIPPAADAAKRLDRLDDLSAKGIAKHVDRLKRFVRDFETAETKADNLLDRATARALRHSASCAVTELESVRSWETSPALYLQVAFTGLEHAAVLPSKNERVREKRFLKRLKAVPGLLDQARTNIKGVSPAAKGLAQTMIRDCARHLTTLSQSSLGKSPRPFEDCLTALRDFDRFMAVSPENVEQDGPSFAAMAEGVLGTDRSAEEMFTVAEREFARRAEALRRLETEVGTDWKAALESYPGPEDGDLAATDVVIREIHRLRSFVFESPLGQAFRDGGLRIERQPLYLASTLRPIHYDPAPGAGEDEPSRCYVSPQIFSGRGFRDDPAHLGRMRREFPFLAARQSYPGRHLVDTQRRALEKTPMAQVASPIFIAGWLGMAENLLEELGYLRSPLERMVHHRRGLARAALAMIDAGLGMGDLDQDRCMTILRQAGYSTAESLERVRTIRLQPGSRVMPVLGTHELDELRRSSGLELPDFCRALFAHGQLAFADLGELMKQ
ncbi:DUF885 family protein [Pseudodesulfovibrio cashew]|uniref:DUF885 family protein n=1 Tax=Pseudodesulfovibrio cashew TaxID=2678688 RepID=A0A6I6JER0_9BACT|nr:DUF885 family protein [Pseudodesulfovibrio cashew]QGY38902.1 DUF885 family protein [Pseudodesulfovibrio cashew]